MKLGRLEVTFRWYNWTWNLLIRWVGKIDKKVEVLDEARMKTPAPVVPASLDTIA